MEKGHQTGNRVPSREYLWHMYRHLDTHLRGESLYDTQDLFAIKLGAHRVKCNEEELEKFLISWDTVLTGMKKIPDDDTLHTLFFNQIKDIEILDYDLKIYERLRESEKNIDTLRRYCERLIELKRSQENQRKRHGEHRQKSPSVSAAGPQRRFPRSHSSGKGRRFSRSKYSRSPGRKRSFSRSPGGGFKRKGKSKSRSRSTGRMCTDFIKGKCTRGAGCKYSHSEKSKRSSSPRRSYNSAASPRRDSKKDGKRSRTPSPKGGGRKRSITPNRKANAHTKSTGCFLFQKGKCHYGTKCIYSHDPATFKNTPAAPATPPEKRQSNNSPCPGTD
jgi:hypothetical protein